MIRIKGSSPIDTTITPEGGQPLWGVQKLNITIETDKAPVATLEIVGIEYEVDAELVMFTTIGGKRYRLVEEPK